MRRLVAILAVGAIMAATMLGGPYTLLGGTKVVDPVAPAYAQSVGQPTCGPWQQARYVSASGWPYIWNWRWCHNPSVQGDPYYVDWASWEWAS